ncbi:MAG: cyclic-di-AMP receptor [Chloroflexi bacterium]|nr:cyclic-di-AMP receptor [Chloroflexota bacterium]
MKMIMAIVPKAEANEVINRLVAAGHTATFMETRGGVLRQASQTLFIAVPDEKLEEVLCLIDRSCHAPISLARTDARGQPITPTETPQVGGAIVFVWDIERFQKY